MKFIETGLQDTNFAEKTYDPKSDSTSVKLIPIKERYLRIYLPWRRLRYCINVDDEVPSQPCWSMYWHRHPKFDFVHFARWAWQ